MPKLTLTLDGRQLQQLPIGGQPVTIGRLPDNLVVINNPAVSGRHARVFRDGDTCVVEDLQSTNGTFVNDKPIARHVLRDCDVVQVGHHVLVFSNVGGNQAHRHSAAPASPPAGDAIGVATIPLSPTSLPLPPSRLGVLRVVAGESAADEYPMTSLTVLIGKTELAQIKLTGWFKPKVAAAVSRSGDGYTVSAVGAATLVNGQPITSRHDLRDGDRIEVCGLTLEFRLKPAPAP